MKKVATSLAIAVGLIVLIAASVPNSLDDTYLRLDTTNDPLTGNLHVTAEQVRVDTSATADSSARFRMQNDVQIWDISVDGPQGDEFLVFDATAAGLPLRIEPGTSASVRMYSSQVDIGEVLRLVPGTTANRPSGVEGMLYANSTNDQLQYYDGRAWRIVLLF